MKKTISRRNFVKYSGIGLATLAVSDVSALANTLIREEQEQEEKNGNVLIAYFSHSGNTRYMAKQIQAQIKGRMFEIRTVRPYPTDYDTVVNHAI